MNAFTVVLCGDWWKTEWVKVSLVAPEQYRRKINADRREYEEKYRCDAKDPILRMDKEFMKRCVMPTIEQVEERARQVVAEGGKKRQRQVVYMLMNLGDEWLDEFFSYDSRILKLAKKECPLTDINHSVRLYSKIYLINQ